ncbi:MAG: hypothetical protein EBU27_10440 [Opitutae bacterium]|nr:hypothetical protein [Opitutae bacterium]
MEEGVEDHLLLLLLNRAMVEDLVGVVRHHLQQALVEALYFRLEVQEGQEGRHYPLIRVKLEASAVDFLISLESLREVYLFETGLDETAIGKLKTAKPQVFVNSG